MNYATLPSQNSVGSILGSVVATSLLLGFVTVIMPSVAAMM